MSARAVASGPPDKSGPGLDLRRATRGAKPGRWIAEPRGHDTEVVSAPRLHAALVRTLDATAPARRRPAGQPRRCVRGRADRAGGAGAERRSGARMARETPASRTAATRSWMGVATVPRPRRSLRSRSHDPAAARRALAYAIARRGLPLPNAADPERRDGLGLDRRRAVARRADRARSARRERADAATMRRRGARPSSFSSRASARTAAGTLATPPSTTSTFAATHRRRRWGSSRSSKAPPGSSRARSVSFSSSWRLEPGGLTVAQALVAYRLHGRGDEVPALLAGLGDDLATAVVPREAARRRLGDARHRAGRAARAR